MESNHRMRSHLCWLRQLLRAHTGQASARDGSGEVPGRWRFTHLRLRIRSRPPSRRAAATLRSADAENGFVNSMSDLFHARVPLSFVRDIFSVIADTPRHTYQVLTKRSTRLRKIADRLDWPPNLWMGVSVENADTLFRVDDLRKVPAAARFVSCEPLLGPVDSINLNGIGWAIAGVSPAQTTDPLTRLGLSRYAIAARPQTCRSSSSSGVDVPPRKAAVFWKGEPGTRSQCR